MVLTNVLTVDLGAKTVTLNTTSSGNLVENIIYSQTTNQIVFSLRADIVISGADFIALVQQINLFQASIIFNFPPNLYTTIPFGSCDTNETHDIVNNNWNLTAIYGASPRLVNYTGSGANRTVDLAARASSKTLDFPEWIYFLALLNHYQLSIKFFSVSKGEKGETRKKTNNMCTIS